MVFFYCLQRIEFRANYTIITADYEKKIGSNSVRLTKEYLQRHCKNNRSHNCNNLNNS